MIKIGQGERMESPNNKEDTAKIRILKISIILAKVVAV